MKKYLTVAIVILMAAPLVAGELVFVGAACSPSWHSDLFLSGDASSAPGPQDIDLTFVPFFDSNTVYGTTVEVQGGPTDWEVWAPNVVCNNIPAENITGTLIVDVPWDATGWLRTWSPPGYGSTVMPGSPMPYSEWLSIPFYDTNEFRCNLLLYNDGPGYAILQVGADWVFLEPMESQILMSIPPDTRLVVASGGVVYSTLSLVDNATNDATTIPLVKVSD